MSLQVDIQKKPNKTDYRKITKPEDVYNLEEVQEIKDALQEHFLFIGLDRANHVRKISLMGIGTSHNRRKWFSTKDNKKCYGNNITK